MRREALLLREMREAIEEIEQIVSLMTAQQLQASTLHRAALGAAIDAIDEG